MSKNDHMPAITIPLLAAIAEYSAQPAPAMSIFVALIKTETQRPQIAGSRRFHQNAWFRLIVGVVGLWGINSLLVWLAIELGTVPTSVNIGLGVCAARPCFQGMVPGVTRWSEVQTIFAAIGNSISSSTTIVAHSRNGIITAYRSIDGLTVRAIDVVSASSSQLALGDVIGQFGQPCSVSFYGSPNNGLTILHYPSVAVSVQASNRLTQDTSVRSISFSTVNPLVDPCRTVGDINRPWHGFASIQHYLSQEQ